MKLLALDLDGTLVGDSLTLQKFGAVFRRHQAEWQLLYATGRSLALAHQLAVQEPLPEPDAWVSDVGTVITYAEGTDLAWQGRMSEGWDRERLVSLVSQMSEMEAQPPSGQGPFKVSYHLDVRHAEHRLSRLKAHFERLGLPVRMVYSGNRYLDIIPAAGGKGPAVHQVLKHFEIPLSDLFACGDSGNDLSMLCLGGRAAAVGNALPELLEDLPDAVYRAKVPYAGGILEGLAHFGWITPSEV